MGFIHEHIILPLSDLVKGERVHYYLRQLCEAETWNDAEMKCFQEKRFRELVQYVSKEVPFYRDWFDVCGLRPNEIPLEELPIVSKSLMRKEGIEQFASESFPKNQRVVSHSSGSTGEPFVFYESKLSYSVNMASKLRTWYQAGYQLGDKYLKITNSPRHGMLKIWQDRLNNCIYIPFQSINNQTLKTISELIEKKRPTMIRSYPAPLFLLAQFRRSHPEYSFSPKHLMTTGATLSDAYRKIMEHAFCCDVIDSYSCEGTPNTYETPVHDGYQVSGYYGIIEILDNNNCPITNGIGRVVSTDLWNYAMPFMRYDTQDLVEVKDGRIIRVVGRESDVLIGDNGEMFTNHNFSHYFLFEIDAVETYQIVKRRDRSVVFRLVVNNRYNDKIEKEIIQYWNNKLGAPVYVEVMDCIPLMNNNKRKVIVNEGAE